MKHKLIIFLLIIFGTMEVQAESSMLGISQDMHISINNRILTKVNGKAISVIDVMKKMDMLFYRQFPQYASSIPARLQFYQSNWKRTLNEIIDKELILVDAEELKINISPGDIRQEMESLFGPNIIINLDKAGLSFDEAYKMVQEEIIIRRMLHFRVQMNALNDVTPQKVRSYYDGIAKDHIRDNEWDFYVTTIRLRDPVKAAEAANLVYHMLTEDQVPLKDLTAKMKELGMPQVQQEGISISEEFKTKEKELSDTFKSILSTITPGSYSVPIMQKSRADNTSVFRIFYLQSMIPGGVVPFAELENKIRNKLINEGVDKGTKEYFSKQRAHFDVQEDQLEQLFSSDFQPFSIR